MEPIIERIKQEIALGTLIPKPKTDHPFYFLDWTMSLGEESICYSIPNHKVPNKPYKKYIRTSELIKAYSELQNNGAFSRHWFNHHLEKLAKVGSCSFTTIGGLFILLGEATYFKKGLYVSIKNDKNNHSNKTPKTLEPKIADEEV